MSRLAVNMAPPTRSGSRRVALAALVLAVAVVQFVVAVVAARQPSNALEIVVALVLLAAALAFPRVVLSLALVATLVSRRVGPAALNLSVTDAVGLLALVAGLRFIPWRDRRLRLVLGALAAYLAALSVTLLPHHASRAVLEWGHRGVLFGGSILIGVAIVHAGVTRPALRLFVAACAALAVAASFDALARGFEPAQVFDLQKNHAGLVLAAGFLVVFAAARPLAWPSEVITALRVLLLVGLAATQSRAAALGLVMAIALRPLLQGNRGRKRQVSIAVLVGCAALLAVTAVSVNERDLSRPADEQKFNAINTRTDVYNVTIQQVWLKNRFVGGGLRYWSDPLRPFPTPHDLVVSELGEAGLIGLAGLVTLLVATAVALRRSHAELAMLAMMAFVLRVTQGFADIFWVAGPLTVALVLVGMGLTDDPGTDDDDPGARERVGASSRLAAPRGLT